MFKNFFKKLVVCYKNLPIVIHPLFVLLGIYFLFDKKFYIFICYLCSAVFHEMGHFILAKMLGYKQLQIKLMPYGAELCGKLDQILYKDEILICLAGPLVSLFIAFVILAIWWIEPELYTITQNFMLSNLICGIFNLLPIYPLDGGRLIVAILSNKMKRENAITIMNKATICFSMLLLLLFAISAFYSVNFTFLFVGIMMLSSASAKPKSGYVLIKNKISRLQDSKKGLEVCEIIANYNLPLYKLLRRFKGQKYYVVRVVDDNFNTLFKLEERVLDNLQPDYLKSKLINLKFLCNYN